MNKLNNTFSTESSDSNILIKLRRLKIEEDLLAKSIKKTCDDVQKENDDIMSNYSELKDLHNELRSSYIDIRDLFDEVKANTCSDDNLKTLDIHHVKQEVLNLEKKIKNFNAYLQSQLKYLQLVEHELVQCQEMQVDGNPDKMGRLKRETKVKTKFFNEIVPSPVKQFINSPFKCPEVQQYQEFMMNSKNRYGGWLPYNYNIFEKTWKKYFSFQKNIENYEYQDVNVENSENFQYFVVDVCNYIPGITQNEIIEYNRWFTKFIYLKERQQRALDKWKMNKEVIRKSKKNGANKSNSAVEQRIDEYTILNIKGAKKKQIDFSTNFNIMVSDGLAEIKNLYSSQIENDHTMETNIQSLDSSQLCTVSEETSKLKAKGDIINKRSPLAYRKSTEQWNNRCSEDNVDERNISIMDLQNISKRRTPDWRLILQKE